MSEQNISYDAIKDIPASSWEKLSQKKIYFGHHSVGVNIIDGISDLMKENPQIKLNIKETNNPSDFDGPVFGHSGVGRNTDPKSKVDAFTNYMAQGIGAKADISFFKFCYVDIARDTDVNKVFSNYKKSIARVKTQNQKYLILHITIPLTMKPTGIKTFIKRLIGKPIWGDDKNVKRNEFNELLENEYKGKAPIFDLAKIESTFPDGRRCTFTKDGKTYYSLVPEYTYDGGHLNEKGRKIIAEQLLIFLANLSDSL